MGEPLRTRNDAGTRAPDAPTAAALVEDRGRAARLAARLGRHVAWLRTEGPARLVEEDRLDPRERLRTAAAARRWRHDHPTQPGRADVALVVGVQRSGTTMVLRGIEHDPSVEVHHENDRRAFERYRLRPEAELLRLVHRSRQRLVLLKPLCDSQRTPYLLELLGRAGHTTRAVWVYRDVDGRARSAVNKFGDVNRRVLTAIARGEGAGRWQAEGLSETSLDLIRSLDPERLDPWSAAALFWLVRNRIYLEHGLVDRPDVHLVSYDRVVGDPEPEIGILARFLGLEAVPALWQHVDLRAARVAPLDLPPRLRRECTELEETLGIAAEMSNHRVEESTS